MAKTAQTELHRLFLIESLPEPITRASSHLQIFDNYIAGTRLRLRQVRDPATRDWTRILQQRFTINDVTKVAEIYLNDAEHTVLSRLAGRDVRKNRYFHEVDGTSVAFDVYLGRLAGLTTAKAYFESSEALANYVLPPFAFFEATGHPSLDGPALASLDIEQLRKNLSN